MAKMNVPNFPMYPVIKHEKMREYSDGIRFGGGLDLRPAPYLPVVEVDRNLNAAKVIKKGTFVTLDSNGFVVPAFVGEKTLEYGQYDVEFGVIDVDSYSNTKAAVTAPKPSTAKIGTTSASDIKIGKPIGMTMFDVYQWDMGKDPWYQVQDPMTILADRMVLLAVDQAHKDVAYEAGDILVLDPSGFPVPFDVTVDDTDVGSVAAAVKALKDTLKYHVGRLVKVIDLTKDKMFTGGLENVEYWPSEFAQGLPGKQNGGVTDGIDETTKKGLLIQLEF